MCGIVGFVDFKKSTSYEVLQKMTDSLTHRGPDGSGYELFSIETAMVGLGHRRLAILDLTENAKQPMHFDSLSITFNGEIYNFGEIKRELIQLGHSFLTESDTEVILHAYQQWKEKCLDKFIGMFAFVILDTHQQFLFIARDRTGIKPIHLYFKENLFLFASELKAFHEHPQFDRQLNLNSVAGFMQYGNVPGDESIFQSCSKLLPGHYALLDLKKKELSTIQYWNVYNYYNRPKIILPFEDAKKETERLLVSACNYRMVSDVPVGVFLSGGYDSSTVTALLQKDKTHKLKTFTIGVPDIGLNEASYAEAVAHYLGTDHTTFICTEKEALEHIAELPFYYDEPFADSSAIPTHLVSKIARKEVTVALSSDGGDEVFAGYNRYDFLTRYGKKINQIPPLARKIIARTMDFVSSERIPFSQNKYNFHNRYEKLKGVLRNPTPYVIMMSLSQQFTENQLNDLMNFKVDIEANAYMSQELQKEFYSPLSYMMAVDYQTYLPDDIMQKVDRATMSVSLEGREPLLDHRLIEWAAMLPDEYKYNNGIKKFILREIAHQYIPKELLNRPKMGFAIPIGKWLTNELKPYLEEYINEKRVKEQGIFNWEYVRKLKTLFLNGRLEYDFKIWYLLMFQMWHDRWMK